MPLGTVDLGLSDHGSTVENDVVVDASLEEATGTMPPLPPAPWFKKTKTSKHTEMHCGRFSKHCRGNDCRDGEESSFFDCWDKQSDILQQADPVAQNAPKSVSRAKICLSVNVHVCSLCQKLGVYQRLPMKALQVTSPVKEKTDRATTPMMESGGLTRWT